MPRLVFINIAVKDIVASTAFYTAIGAVKNDQFSNETVSCMVFSESIHVMIMTYDIFKGFMAPSKSLADPTQTSEVLICISVDKREEVDQIVDVAASLGAMKDPTVMPQMPGMYGRSFEDLDGHHWELMYMDPEVASKENCQVGDSHAVAADAGIV